MTTRFRGLSIRDLQDLHANAPTTIIAYDEHGSPAYTSGPCFGFYKAVHTALPDLLSAVGTLGAALDAAEAEKKELREALETTVHALYRYDWDTCSCEQCKECGKMPKECTGTACAQTCQCTVCAACDAEDALAMARSALGREGGEEKG